LTKIILDKNKKNKNKKEESTVGKKTKKIEERGKYYSNPQKHTRKTTILSLHVFALCIKKIKSKNIILKKILKN
jgi:hypothetical protein